MAKLESATFQDFPLALEYRKGDTRSGTSPAGKAWSQVMQADYGYIKGTKGLDGDACDVYVGTDEEATEVYCITQLKAPDFKTTDEQKFMLGFPDAATAKATYLKHYPDPKIFGGMKALKLEDFRSKVMATSEQAKKVAMKYLELELGMRERGEKTAGDFTNVTIGALIGATTGRITGALLGRDSSSSVNAGALGGGLSGAFTSDAGKHARTILDLARSADSGDLMNAVGRAAVTYSPEAIGGAGSAMFFARPAGPSARQQFLMAQNQQKVAELVPSFAYLTESEKVAFLGGVLSSPATRRLTAAVGGGAAKPARGGLFQSPATRRLRSAATASPPPPVPKPVTPKPAAPANTAARPVPKTNPGVAVVPAQAPAPRKPLITAGRAATVGALGVGALGLYGGYKGINAASSLVSHTGGEPYAASSVPGSQRPF
jgi:outer membrane lipoprotein SlyB